MTSMIVIIPTIMDYFVTHLLYKDCDYHLGSVASRMWFKCKNPHQIQDVVFWMCETATSLVSSQPRHTCAGQRAKGELCFMHVSANEKEKRFSSQDSETFDPLFGQVVWCLKKSCLTSMRCVIIWHDMLRYVSRRRACRSPWRSKA